jgi:chromosome segregation ATPase
MRSRYRRKDGSLFEKVYDDRWHRRYVCVRGRYSETRCDRPSIGATRFEDEVWTEVRRVIEDPGTVQAIIDARRRELEEGGTLVEVESLKRQLQQHGARRGRVLNMFEHGDIDRAEMQERLGRVDALIAKAKSDLSNLERAVNDYDGQVEILNNFIAMSQTVHGELDSMSDEKRAEMVGLLVRRIEVSEGEIEVKMGIETANLQRDSTFCLPLRERTR